MECGEQHGAAPAPQPQTTFGQAGQSGWQCSTESFEEREFVAWTVNVTGWGTFKGLLETDFFAGATAICIQETKLRSEELISAAVKWMHDRGWWISFGRAQQTLREGLSSGVAVAVRAGLNIGVTEMTSPFTKALEHRLLGVRVSVPGMVPMVLTAAYFQHGIGLSGTNLDMLAALAVAQESEGIPVLAGCDCNFAPGRLREIDFGQRASMFAIAPKKPTYLLNKTARVLDYFLASDVLETMISSVQVATDAPISPHRPVALRANLKGDNLVPVLQMPQRIPVHPPFGPRPEPSCWEDLHRTMMGLREVCTRGTRSSAEEGFTRRAPGYRQPLVDAAYAQLIGAVEREVGLITDTVLKDPGYRASPPRIIMVPAATRCCLRKKAWKTFGPQYRWLLNKLHETQACVQGGSLSWLTEILAESLEIPPDFHGAASLLEDHHRFCQLLGALQSDWVSGALTLEIAHLAIDQLKADLDGKLSAELSRGYHSAETAWRQWVRESGLSWQHRWSKSHDLAWRPTAMQGGAWSGRPTELLQSESQRLSKLWEASDVALPPLDFDVEYLPTSLLQNCALLWVGLAPKLLRHTMACILAITPFSLTNSWQSCWSFSIVWKGMGVCLLKSSAL